MEEMISAGKKIRLLVVGIGGVGGYFGGLLAKAFYHSNQLEVCFLARGPHLKAIQQNGLEIIQGVEKHRVHPTLASDQAAAIGEVDFVLLCVKSFDLEEVCTQIIPCVNAKTFILPLLNGVDNEKRIQKIFPRHLILHGCVYIISRIIEAGKVQNLGNIQSLYFGLDGFQNDQTRLLESIFKQANIEATYSTNISQIIWEKYIFLSPIATATSYFDHNIGEIINNPNKRNELRNLVKEVIQLAQQKEIPLPENILERTINKYQSLPPHITSSMHSDFQNHKKKKELEILTAYVIHAAKSHGIETPSYAKMYEALN